MGRRRQAVSDRTPPGQDEADIKDVAIHLPEDVGQALVHLAEVAGGTVVIELQITAPSAPAASTDKDC